MVHTLKIAREELYERVWTTPMRQLAVEFGMSDVGLAKVCKRLNVPRPGRGYWARIESGVAVPRTPLPKTAVQSTAVIRVNPPKPPESDDERRAREVHEALVARFSVLCVPESLENPHRLTVRTQKRFEAIQKQVNKPRRTRPRFPGSAWLERPRDDNGRYECLPGEGFPAVLSLLLVPRALLILDALAKAIEKQKFRLEFDSDKRVVEAVKDAEGIRFRMWESYSRRAVPPPEVERRRAAGEWAREHEYVGNGRLALEISGREWGTTKVWRDGKKDKLEDRLADIVATFIEYVPMQGALREQRLREEKERLERERIEAERHWQEAEERREFEALVAEASRSDTLKQLRKYLDEVEQAIREEVGDLPHISAEWLAKTRARIVASDPFGERVAQLLRPETLQSCRA